MGQLAVAWCLKNESVNCLLLGATSVEQFKENIHALQVIVWVKVFYPFLLYFYMFNKNKIKKNTFRSCHNLLLQLWWKSRDSCRISLKGHLWSPLWLCAINKTVTQSEWI